MRRAALILTLSLALATSAQAGGVNLSWDDCGSFGNISRNFACDTNAGSNQIYVSAMSPTASTQVLAVFARLEIRTNPFSSLSPWWTMDASGCRMNAMTADFSFVGGPFNCRDPWVGSASGGSSYTSNYPNPGYARFAMGAAESNPISVDDATEYYFFRVTLSNAKTVGAGACPGCTDGACITLLEVDLAQPAGVGDIIVTNPITRNFVIWPPGASGGCPIVPTRNTTWGSIKSLYR